MLRGSAGTAGISSIAPKAALLFPPLGPLPESEDPEDDQDDDDGTDDVDDLMHEILLIYGWFKRWDARTRRLKEQGEHGRMLRRFAAAQTQPGGSEAAGCQCQGAIRVL